MKRSLPFLVVAVAWLVAPSITLAADQPMKRAWQLTAIVIDGVRTKVEGKLWINATNLGASAGCNSIGAEVKIEGDVITVVGPASMTEMACPGFNGQAESLLLKVLAGGKFTMEATKWTGEVGVLEASEIPVAPVDSGVPPDQPITNDPNCVNIVVPDRPNGGTDGAVPGDSGSGSGEGSGSGSSGSGGSNGTVGLSGATTGGGPAAGSGEITILPAPGGAEAPPAPTPLDPSCANVGSGVAVDPGTTVGTGAPEPQSVVDTARDVLFVPLAIAFALLVVVTIWLLLRGGKPAKAEPTDT